MFLFSKKYKTPVSTYTDSYRPPSSIKMKLQDLNLQPIFKENNFVTQGLTMPPVENTVSHSQSEQKKEMQLYKRNSISPASYQPWNYSLATTGEHMVADTEYMLPPYTVGEKGTSPSYYSPSSGCYYCLQGMDSYTDGSSAARRSIPSRSYSPKAMLSVSTQHPQPYDLYSSTYPRWDTSHFINIGGVQRGSYIIHPEFASEASFSRGHY